MLINLNGMAYQLDEVCQCQQVCYILFYSYGDLDDMCHQHLIAKRHNEE